MIVVDDPQETVDFLERFKTESAHYINRLLGRRQRTVWCEGYDSPPILTLENAIDKFVYLFTNPQSAGLVETISHYPGLSSWEHFGKEKHRRRVPRVRRHHVPVIPRARMSHTQQAAFAREIERESTEKLTITLYPNDWVECFETEETPESLNSEIREKISTFESANRQARTSARKRFLGADSLRLEPFNKPYTPKKFSKRMWCICSDVPLRISFIAFLKGLLKEAEYVKQRWKLGDYSLPFPLGLFPPTPPRLGNLVPPYEFA